MYKKGVLGKGQGICEGSLGFKWDRGDSKQACLTSGVQPDVLMGTGGAGGALGGPGAQNGGFWQHWRGDKRRACRSSSPWKH